MTRLPAVRAIIRNDLDQGISAKIFPLGRLCGRAGEWLGNTDCQFVPPIHLLWYWRWWKQKHWVWKRELFYSRQVCIASIPWLNPNTILTKGSRHVFGMHSLYLTMLLSTIFCGWGMQEVSTMETQSLEKESMGPGSYTLWGVFPRRCNIVHNWPWIQPWERCSQRGHQRMLLKSFTIAFLEKSASLIFTILQSLRTFQDHVVPGSLVTKVADMSQPWSNNFGSWALRTQKGVLSRAQQFPAMSQRFVMKGLITCEYSTFY